MNKKKVLSLLLLFGIIFVVIYLFKPLNQFSSGLKIPLETLIDKKFIDDSHKNMFVFKDGSQCVYTISDGENIGSSVCEYYFVEDSIKVVDSAESEYKFLVLNSDCLYSSTFKSYFWGLMNEKFYN